MNFSRLAAQADLIGMALSARRFRTGWPASTRPGIRFYEGGAAHIRYRERGSGQTIVFAADPPVTLELYDDLLQHFATDFRVVVFELPGMGFSAPKAGYDFGFETCNDAVAEFLGAVVREPAVLAFSCAAGFAAVDIAVRHPQLVSHLVLMQTPSWAQGQQWKHGRDPKHILGRPFIGQLLMRRLKHSRAPLWYALSLGERGKLQPFCACAQETIAHGAGWHLASAFQMYLSDERSGLPRASQPALVLWGLADGSHQHTDKASSAELCAAAEVEHYADLGHFPELEDPQRVFCRIERFLREHPVLT